MIGGVRQFEHLRSIDELFAVPPQAVTDDTDRDGLAEVLGASLYAPATRADLLRDIAAARVAGTVSMVLDLEDSVEDQHVEHAFDNLVTALTELWQRRDDSGPGVALFVRVRHVDGIVELLDRLGDAAALLSGIVVPKFSASWVTPCFDAIRAAADALGHRLYVMPVIETREFIRADTRLTALAEVREALTAVHADVLTVRIGGTDFAGLYGLRRTPDLTIYDVRVVAAALGDIVNMLGEPGIGFRVSGPVWEHFAPRERVLRPQLRATPFVEHDAVAVRDDLLLNSYDGLIREVLLDRANGMTGKSVIHPDQASIVNALQVVTDEEYRDAQQIAATGGSGGAAASEYRNKMNESRPHSVWAHRTLRRAAAFGVTRPGRGFIDVLADGAHQ